MEFIILILIILTNSIAISKKINKKIEQAIPITVITMTIIVYIAGLFDNVNIGVKIVEIISIITTIYNAVNIVKSIKNKQTKKYMKTIITPRIISIYSGVFVVHNNK